MLKNKLEKGFFKKDSEQKVISEKFDELSQRIEQSLERLDCLEDRIDILSKKLREYVSLEIATLDPGSRVLVMGFYGARNIGDELMLRTLLDYYDEKNIEVTIMMSDNYVFDTSFYAPHQVIHYPKKPNDIALISKKFDMVIWGGGAMLDDHDYYYNGDKTILSYSLMAISKAVIKHHGKVVVLGVSANEKIEDKNFIEDLKYVINGAAHFSLRDTNSLETLKQAGIQEDKIEIVDDLALAQLKWLKEEKGPRKKKLIIGLVYILSEETFDILSGYTKKMIEYLNKNLKDSVGVEIMMIPFYDYQNNDYRLFQRMKEELEETKFNKKIVIKINDNLNNSEEVINVLASCDVVFAMRYHALLLASCAGVRTVSLDYSPKHRHYYNKIKYVKECYSPEVINFSFGDSPEKFEKTIKSALSIDINNQKKKEQAQEIINRLHDLLARVLVK